MKNVYYLIVALIMTQNLQGSYYYAKIGPRNESVEQAFCRFDIMPVRQIKNVCIHELTQNQLQAFRNLATEYFMSEVIRPNCSNQARRRKYEVMYRKIGELGITATEPQLI